MTIQAFYETIQEDYEDVLDRFMMENLLMKYVLKFKDDPTFDLLKQALENHEIQGAIRHSHTFKGICDNLGFMQLKKQSEEMMVLLKEGAFQKAQNLFPALCQEYLFVIENIQKLM